MPKIYFPSILVLALIATMATGCKDACEKDNPCVNGTCSDVDGEAVCNCNAGWEGSNCDTPTPVDPCTVSDPCANGTCVNNNGVAECECDPGYEGTTCETENRDKFEGNWTYTDSCLPGDNSTSNVTEASSSVMEVRMSNILGTDLGGTATATVDADQITIPQQTVVDSDGDDWVVSSTTGTMANNQFSLVVTYSFGANSATCTLTFTR